MKIQPHDLSFTLICSCGETCEVTLPSDTVIDLRNIGGELIDAAEDQGWIDGDCPACAKAHAKEVAEDARERQEREEGS